MDAFERNRRRLEENQRRLDALRMQNNKPASTERPKQSFFNKVRDQFDANTASDQYRRQQAGDARLYSRQQKDRGIGRVANNPWERTLNLGKSIGESVYATPKRLGQAVEEVVNGNKTQQSFNQLNQTNQKVLNKVNARLANPNLTPAERSIQEDIRQKMIRLQRQGYDDQRKEFGVAADKLDPKKNAAAVADAALTIASAGVAGVAMKTAGQTAAKLGYRAAARQAAPAFFKNMGLNTAQSVTDTVANIGEGRQAGWKDIAKGGVVGATVGSVADVGLGLIPGVIGKRQYDKLLKDLASETDAGIVKQTVAAVNKNLPDEAVDNLSNDIAKAGTPDEVNKLLNEAADAEASVATKAVGNTVDNPTAPKPETPAIPNTAVTPEIVQGFKQAKTPQQARDAVKALFPELDETTANKVIQDLAQAKDDKTITQILEQAQTRRTAVTQGVQDVTPQAEAIAPTPEQQIAEVAQNQPTAQLTSQQAPDTDIQANQVTQRVDDTGTPVSAVQDAVDPLESLKQEARKYKSELDELEKIKEQFVQKYGDTSQFSAKYADRYLKLRDELLPKAEDAIIETQGLKKVYHGTTHKWEGDFKEKDTFFTPNKKFAENVADEQVGNITEKLDTDTSPDGTSYYPTIVERYLPKDSKIFDATNKADIDLLANKLPENVKITTFIGGEANMPKSEVLDLLANDKNSWQLFEGEIKNIIRKNGYDGWKASEKGYESIGLFNPNNTLKKQQLTDLYDQATQPPKSTPVQKVDPLESLKQEARKYGSAEEFRKNLIYNDDIIIHQTGKNTADKIKSEGFKAGKETGLGEKRSEVYGMSAYDWMNHKKFSKDTYARDGSDVAEVAIDTKGLKIIDRTKQKFTDEEYVKGIHKQIPDGYDGVKVGYGNGVNEVLLKPEVANARRFNIDDLYNQATQAQPPKSTPVQKVAKADHWTTPLPDDGKRPPITAKDTNGVIPKEGDVIEFPGVLGGKGRTTVHWQGPVRANASGKEIPGQWIGNGVLREDNLIPFTVVERNGKPLAPQPTKKPTPFEQNLQTAGLAPKKAKGLVVSETKPLNGQKIQKVRTAPVEGKVGQVVAPEVPTQTTRAVADANPEIVVPETVTNAGTLRGEFQKQVVDKDANYINYLKKVEKETGQTGLVDQFYYDSGLQRRSNSIANSTANNSENLTGAFQGLTGKSKQEFDRYVELRNEIANANRGLKTAEKLDSLVAQEQALAGTYGTRFESLNNYYKEWATKLREGGLIDEPTYQSFIQNNDYTHIQRVMDDIAGFTGGTGGNSMSLGSTKARLKRTGSERAIQPADITALNYGQKMQSEIQRNKTASDMIDVLVGQGHAKQVPADQAARKNTIRRIVDGKTEIYQVPRDIKEIADNITPFQLGTLGKIVAAPQRVLRAGATGLSAPFTAANYVKDQVGSAVFSKNVAATHLDPRNALSGLWNATRDTLGESNNPLWKKFIESSGDTTGYDFLRNAKDAKRMSREVRLGKKGKYANMVTAPIRTLEELNAITEKATRFQNFKGVYESALKRTNNEAEALREATLAAWQNSVDFSRMGSTAQAINLLIPYFNAGIQGTRLLGRRFGEAPVGTTMKTLGFVALPMAGLTLYNLSDEKRKAVYDNISDYEKENNLIIVLPNAEQKPDGSYDGVIKVPLQQGLTNLAQPFRMQAENFAGKSTPNEVAQMAQQFFGAFAGPIGTGSLREAAGSAIPQVVKPFVQQGMNKDLFTGKEIVPDYINEATDAQGNNVAEKDKAYKFTSGTARAIGGKLGVSPLRVEKFIKDVTAKTGLYALNATDNALAKLGKIPEEQIGGISVKDDIIRRFARAQGTYNYKKSEGGKYYDRVKDATKSLNGNEKAAWDSIHPSKTNFLGEDIFDENKRLAKYTKAGLYLQHPKVFEAERAIEMEQRKQGSPANPLYDLPKEQLAKVLLKDALPPGAKDDELSNLFKQEWYQDFKNKQSAYYTQLKQKLEASGKTMPVSDNPYPVTSPELQKHMDYYSSLPKGTGARSSFIKGNPKIWASMTSQWQATDDWENKERVKIGLNPITDDQSSGSSSGGKFGYSNGGGSGGKGKKEATPKTYIGQLLGDVPSVSSNEINIKTTPKRAKLKVKTPSGKGRNYKKIKLG